MFEELNLKDIYDLEDGVLIKLVLHMNDNSNKKEEDLLDKRLITLI